MEFQLLNRLVMSRVLPKNTYSFNFCLRNCFHNVSSVTKIHRDMYTRTYPTTVVLPDGASVNIRYHEPRKIIKLPLDLSQLTEEERKMRLERRKPKKKVKITDDIEDEFNGRKYLKFMKKTK